MLGALILGVYWAGGVPSWISKNEGEKVITVMVASNQRHVTIEYLAWGPQSGELRSVNRADGEQDSPYVDEIIASTRETVTVTITGYSVDLDDTLDFAEVTVKIFEDSELVCLNGPHRTKRGQHTVSAFCKHTSFFKQ